MLHEALQDPAEVCWVYLSLNPITRTKATLPMLPFPKVSILSTLRTYKIVCQEMTEDNRLDTQIDREETVQCVKNAKIARQGIMMEVALVWQFRLTRVAVFCYLA